MATNVDNSDHRDELTGHCGHDRLSVRSPQPTTRSPFVASLPTAHPSLSTTSSSCIAHCLSSLLFSALDVLHHPLK